MKSGRLTVIVRAVLPAALALVCAASAAHAALVVSKAATRNVTCTSGICTATAVNAVLNVNDLAAMLAAGSVRMNSGAMAMDIRVVTAVSWASTNRLFLDAYRSIDFRAPLTVEGTGNLVLATNDGGTGGDLIFEDKGHVAFWDLSSSLTINGSAYTLVGDLTTFVIDINAMPWGYFAWARDYDASVDGAYKSSLIAIAFVGTLEGLGNKIEKIRFAAQKAGNFGLFALIENGGLVRDLTLSDVRINIVPDAAFAHIATIAAENHGTIEASSSSGAIKSGANYCCARVGGLVAVDKGAILHSHSSVNIAGTGVVGGLVGEHITDGSSARTISDSYATGNVTTGSGSYGGLVGSNTKGPIINGHATGSVAAGLNNNSNAGGLVGENHDVIEASYATGSITAGSYSGGLAGQNFGSIETSFATGSVTAGGNSGGLVGQNSGSIEMSFATGDVSGTAAGGLVGADIAVLIDNSYALGNVTGGKYSGGLMGISQYGAYKLFTSYSIGAVSGPFYDGGLIGYTAYSPANDAYVDWDVDTSGVSEGCGNRSCFGVKGLSDAQLKSKLPAGFDSSIWGQSAAINNGYPYLLANPPR